jgi:hypothetical protein
MADDRGHAAVRVDRVFLRNGADRPCPHVLSLTVARHSETLALGSWLDRLPHSSQLCVAVCLKGLNCDDEETVKALGAIRNVRVHSCVEVPGGSANGHEGVCAFRFLLDNYGEPWTHVYFAHADVHKPKHAVQFQALRSYLARNEWPVWPRSIAKLTQDHCGCVGAMPSKPLPFGPVDFWWPHITWWLGNFVSLAEPSAAFTSDSWASQAACSKGGCSRAGFGAYLLNNGTWSSPIGFMFAVDRAAALQRSKEWLRAQYRMNKHGVRVLPPGMGSAPRAARLTLPGFDFAPLPWAHVNERLPFVLFGHDFVEQPVPKCVLVGDHADQNCSYNNVQSREHRSKSSSGHEGGHRAGVPRPTAAVPQPKPALDYGCKPGNQECGTRG